MLLLLLCHSLYESLNNVKILNLKFVKKKSLVIISYSYSSNYNHREEDDAVLKLPGFKHCTKTYLLNCVLLNEPQLTLYSRLTS